MSDNCIFCKIAAGDAPARIAYQDDDVVAFHDIHPQAPVHILVVPREHIGSLDDLQPSHGGAAGRLLMAVPEVARQAGLDRGYRVIVNTGPQGGQTVPHLHLHILGGRQFTERMVGE